MKDSLKTYAHSAMDSLQQHPILKGALPTAGGVGMTFLEGLDWGLRITGVIIGIAIGCLTLYVKWKEAKALRNSELNSKKKV